jgi:hypothetical protein
MQKKMNLMMGYTAVQITWQKWEEKSGPKAKAKIKVRRFFSNSKASPNGIVVD